MRKMTQEMVQRTCGRDSLALYNLFAGLDPALDSGDTKAHLQSITAILMASSNVAANTLESAVTALGELFGASNTTFTGNEFDTDRDKLYKALKAIDDASTCYGGPLTVCDLTALTNAQIAAAAHGNIAYRYALVNLVPFAVAGNDSVYDRHNTKRELDLYDPAAGTGELTGQYLTDRALMLVAMNLANTGDGTVSVDGKKAAWAQQGGDNIYYQDNRVDADGKITTTTIYQGCDTSYNMWLDRVADKAATDMWQFKFGSDQADTLAGGNLKNHLYGGAGNDIRYRDAANDTRYEMERKVA